MSVKQRKRIENPLQDLQNLVDRARKGDETALPELRKSLDENSTVWRTVGDLNKHVETAWLDAIAGGDLFARDCIERELRQMRSKLRKTCRSALEKQLAESVVLCHLQLRHAELLLAAVADGPRQQQNFYSQRVAACHRRYSTAVAQLLKARELLGKDGGTATTHLNRSESDDRVLGAGKALAKAKKRKLRVVSA